MSMDDLDHRLLVGCAVARDAGALARRYFVDRHALTVESKGLQDYVSVADREVERSIVETLGRAFPGDGFLGEEGGGIARDCLWVIDPIDGTANFLRGLPAFGVSIAYVRDGEVEIGIIYDPMTDELFAARRGAGATRNGEPIRVSATAALSEAVIGIGFSYRAPVGSFVETAGRLLSAQCEFRRFGTCVLGMAHVADGRLDGYWEQHINSWDVLAGIALVREAGGWTNDFLAGEGLMHGNPILACAPGLRADLGALTGVG
ncbi:MAG: inositol monophosphatase family protein [Dongiaceae bacterium]